MKAELFPAEVRALGVGLPYAIANALFGGTAEYVALSLEIDGVRELYSSSTSPLMAGVTPSSLPCGCRIRGRMDISRGQGKSKDHTR